jgi:hypothetical protein
VLLLLHWREDMFRAKEYFVANANQNV